jgi:hypothetical protein
MCGGIQIDPVYAGSDDQKKCMWGQIDERGVCGS